MAIKQRIDNEVKLADRFYESNQFAEALIHYDKAKSLAQKFLPNAVSYTVLERAKQCQVRMDVAQ